MSRKLSSTTEFLDAIGEKCIPRVKEGTKFILKETPKNWGKVTAVINPRTLGRAFGIRVDKGLYKGVIRIHPKEYRDGCAVYLMT